MDAKGRGRGRGRGTPTSAPPPPGAQQPPPPAAAAAQPQRGSPPQPSSPVAKDQPTQDLSKGVAQMALSTAAPVHVVKRPNVGKLGRPIPLRANYFKIDMDGNLVVHHYKIVVEHEHMRKLRKDENREIFWTTIKNYKGVCFKTCQGIAYDSADNCFMVEKATFQNGDTNAILEIPHLLSTSSSNRDSKCKTSFSYIGQVHVDLHAVVNPSLLERDSVAVQVLDIVMRTRNTHPMVQTPFVAFNSSFYRDPGVGRGINLGAGREIWHGFYAAAHVLSGKNPFLNVDTSSTAFFKAQSVLDFVRDVMRPKMNPRDFDNRYDINRWNAQTTMTPMDIDIFRREIKGLQIEVTHTTTLAKRVYKVVEVTREPANKMKFMWRKDREGPEVETTVADYFGTQYQPLKFPGLPCLWVGSKTRNNYIPLEVARIRHGQKSSKKLTEEQTSVMIKNVCWEAPLREQKINEMVEAAGFANDPFASAFGLKLNPKMTECQGRVIQPPTLAYANRVTSQIRDGSGTWKQNGKFFIGAAIPQWALMSFAPQQRQGELENFAQTLSNIGNNMGMRMEQWPFAVKYLRREEEIEPNLRAINKDCQDQFKQDCSLVVVVLEHRNSSIYAEVKRASEIAIGMMTQCVLLKNATLSKPMTLENICLKINTKMGGINCQLQAEQTAKKFLNGAPTLILGVDVTHPPPRDEIAPSIASVIGNIDLDPSKFWCKVKVQKHRREHVVHMKDAVAQMLTSFYASTKKKPERIIVYRDGVSDGQFKAVLAEELGSIKQACIELDAKYRPQITYIVVQKRHHVRFFCANQRDYCGKAKNIPPGTVVDTTVVHPYGFDFFLCSHFGIQGTSRPIHYHVLYDDSNFSADEIQAVTYNLTCVYMRCTRSVSIPAPVYYADLVCTRARSHLYNMVRDSSSDTVSMRSGQSAGREGPPSSISEDELLRAATVHTSLEKSMYFS